MLGLRSFQIIVAILFAVFASSCKNAAPTMQALQSLLSSTRSASSITINQATSQADPATNLAVNFDVVFGSDVDPGTFTTTDLILDAGSTATVGSWAITQVTAQIFVVTANLSAPGIVKAKIGAASVLSTSGVSFEASSSVDNSVTVGDPATLSISGSPSYDFGTIIVNAVQEATLTVSHMSGIVPASGVSGSLTSGFNFKGGSYPGVGGDCGTSIAVGQTCNIVVVFQPTSAGAHSSNININYNNGATATSTSRIVSGTAVNAASLNISGASTVLFPNTAVSTTSSPIVLTVTNSGQVDATSVASSLSGPFSFAGGGYPGTGGDCNSNVVAGSSCQIAVTFSPSILGLLSGTLTLSYNNGMGVTTATKDLEGTGVNPAILSITDVTVNDFGSVVLGSSANLTFTVNNSGGSPANSMTPSGLAAPFSLSGGSCTTTLPAGDSCSLIVEFSPSSGGLHTDALVLDYNNGLTPQTTSRAIQGIGVSAAVLSISDGPSYDYGVHAVGASGSKTFTVSNSGGSPATGISVSGLAAPFSHSGGTCGATLASAASCTVVVQFSPTSTGISNDTIDIQYNDGASIQSAYRDVVGTGAAPALLSISPGGLTYDFGNITTTSSMDQVFTVDNIGAVSATAISITGLGGPFSIVSDSCGSTIPAYSSCSITFRFNPTVDGYSSTSLSLAYDDGAGAGTPLTKTLEGTGVAPGLLTLSGGASYSFGTVLTGYSQSVIFTVSNTGGSLASSLSGPLSLPFEYVGGWYPGTGGNCPLNINNGSSCTIAVRFIPTATGSHNQNLDISYNNGLGSASVTKALSGQGYQASSAGVVLFDPVASPSNDTTPTVRVSNLISGLQIKMYSDSICSTEIGQVTSAGTNADLGPSSALGDGNWNFYFKIFDSHSNGVCLAPSLNYILDATPPANPSGWSFLDVGNGTHSSDSNPMISGTAAGENGSQARIYSDASCTTQIGGEMITAGAFTFSSIFYTPGGGDDGAKNYYGQIVDQALNQSACTDLSLGYTFDSVAPSPAGFNSIASYWTTSPSVSPNFSWSASASSDVNRYEVGLSTSAAGGNDVAGWVNKSLSLSHSFSGLSLSECVSYYPTVHVRDHAGQYSTKLVFPFFKLDNTIPTGFVLSGTNGASTSSTPNHTWTSSFDSCSGISHYQMAVGTTSGGTDVSSWVSIGNINGYQMSGLSLSRGITYYTSVRAVDVAGNVGPHSSVSWMVENISPLTGWINGASMSVPAGVNRALVVTVSSSEAAAGASRAVASLSYGGQPLTYAFHSEVTASGRFNRVEVWYLLDAGLSSAGGTIISVTWVPATPQYFQISSAVMKNVNQASPIINFSTGSTTSLATSTTSPPVNVGVLGAFGVCASSLGGSANPSYVITTPGYTSNASVFGSGLSSATFLVGHGENLATGSNVCSTNNGTIANRITTGIVVLNPD